MHPIELIDASIQGLAVRGFAGSGVRSKRDG
jgi:hypothetical protein